MVNLDEIKKLAELSRITITEEEAQMFSGDVESILGYVSEIQKVTTDEVGVGNPVHLNGLHNVMREDEEPHESGLYTERILAEAPSREGDYFKVKKIL